jgi:hypothetical protein
VWMREPWPASMMPEAVIVGLLTAVAAGVLGGWIGTVITPNAKVSRPPSGFAALGGLVALFALIGWTLPMGSPTGVRAQVALHQVAPPPHRTATMTVRLSPPDAAQDAEWFNATAWQGGGSVIAPLRRVGPGVYTESTPIPVWGKWKTTVRLHKGNVIAGLGVYFPADSAIPAPAVRAPAQFTRPFVRDKQLLQREQKKDVAGWVTTVAYLAVLAIALAVIAALGWGLRRMGDRVGPAARPPRSRTVRGTTAPAS